MGFCIANLNNMKEVAIKSSVFRRCNTNNQCNNLNSQKMMFIWTVCFWDLLFGVKLNHTLVNYMHRFSHNLLAGLVVMLFSFWKYMFIFLIISYKTQIKHISKEKRECFISHPHIPKPLVMHRSRSRSPDLPPSPHSWKLSLLNKFIC